MERLNKPRLTTALGTTLVLLATTAAFTGCKSTRSEVPPHRPFSPDGKQAPFVGFSSEPDSINPNGFAPMPGSSLSNGGGPAGQVGMPGSGSNVMGAPTGNAYGSMGRTNPTTPLSNPSPAADPSPTTNASDAVDGSSKVPTPNPFD